MVLILYCFITPAICQKLKSLNLIYSYPVSMMTQAGNENKVLSLTDTITINYYNNYILYILPATADFESNNKIQGSEPYFIYKNNNKRGFLFNPPLNLKKGIELPVDSFLTKRALKTKGFDTPNDTVFKLINSVKNKDFIIEKFTSLKKGDQKICDSIIYYFSKKLNHFEFSFSRKLDSIKQMKLYKYRIIFNKKFWPSYKTIIEKMEYSFEIQPASLPNKNSIIDFIKKFKIFSQNNKNNPTN